eukprot:COSAG06_NODE_52343_length_306_cov_0.826087_1_plen_62_part_01
MAHARRWATAPPAASTSAASSMLTPNRCAIYLLRHFMPFYTAKNEHFTKTGSGLSNIGNPLK